MDRRKAANSRAEEVKAAQEKYEYWRKSSSTPEPEAISIFIEALERYNDALEDLSVQLNRRLRRANARKSSVYQK